MKKYVLFLAAIAAMTTAQAASLRVMPERIDTEGERATIQIVNLDPSTPLTLEAYSIPVRADGHLGVYPPSITVPPGETQVFRLNAPKNPGSTQYWRVRISEVQPRNLDEDAQNGVRNEISFDFPVFQNKRGARPDLVRAEGLLRNVGERQALITKIGSRSTLTYLLPGDAIPVGAEPIYSGEAELSVR